MKLHGGPNLARGPEFDTHFLQHRKHIAIKDMVIDCGKKDM